MASAGALYIAIKGDSKDLIKALKNAQNVTVQGGQKMEKSLNRVGDAVRTLQTAVAALGGVWALREISQLSDA